MREQIEKLSRGVFERETGKLSLSEKKLELEIDLEKDVTGIFTITAPDEKRIKGTVFSSNPRMKCKVTEFEDFFVEIPYEFDSTGMEEGDVLKGEIIIISKLGEYYLPFVASVNHSVLRSSVGTIKNLFHFTNLAQSDFEEAVKLFYSREFQKIFVNNDKIYLDTYLGLSGVPGSRQNVEEFLISIHKKSAVSFQAEQEVVELEDIWEEQMERISLRKIGWGFVDLKIVSDAAFLIPDKEALTAEDFMGNHCELLCRIDASKLHAGQNYGVIRLCSPYNETKIIYRIHMGNKKMHSHTLHREMNRLQVELTNTYISFRIKNMNTSSWIKESMTIVEHMLSLDDTRVDARLFQAQLLLSSDRFQEAKWILDHVETDLHIKEQSPVFYGYYLYLLSLYERDEKDINRLAHEVRELYAANKQKDRLLWILLYLDEQIGKSATQKLNLLERQFETGSTSPILYIEAYHIYIVNPTLMTKLEDFELQILLWSVKMGLHQENLIKQVVYLSSRMKRFSPFLHRILCAYYEESGEDEILMAICSHLIKGNMTAEEFFPWYEKAVEKEMRITRLYEYYMDSVPLSRTEPLPRMVQMYFAYNSDLDYRRNAFLYHSLIRNREENPEMLRSYEAQLGPFAIEQLKAEHMDENLAAVYEYMTYEPTVLEELKKHIPQVLFAYRIICEDDRIRNAILITPQMDEEQKIPLSNGVAYTSIFGQDYELFLEDESGNRYHDSVPFKMEEMMKPMRFLADIRENAQEHIGLCIFLSEENKHYISVHEDKVDFIRRIVDSPLVRESYKRELRLKLIHYYYDSDRIQELDEFLVRIDAKILLPRDRAELIEFMVRRGMQEEAYEIVRVYGTENIGSKILVKLCSKIIRLADFEEEEYLLQISYLVFRAGKYDQTVLQYLAMYYHGTIKEMRNIWKAAVGFEVDTHNLEERMIVQMLYTRAFIGEKEDIFEVYQKKGAVTKIEIAYLTYNAYEYFIEDSLMDERVFAKLLSAYRKGEELNDVCKLSLIRFFGEGLAGKHVSTLYDDTTKEIIHHFLYEMLRRNIVFDFFKAYEEEIAELMMYRDKTLVEYKTHPNSHVVLHYVLEGEEEDDVRYMKEDMKNMFGGIFSKEFILFFGETLQYYITEEMKDKEYLTQSLVIHNNDISINGIESKYDALNDMMISRTLQDDESMLSLMEVYLKKEFVAKEIFRIK